MEITTKFSHNSTAFLLSKNVIKQIYIKFVQIEVNAAGTKIVYITPDDEYYLESQLLTKQELMDKI